MSEEACECGCTEAKPCLRWKLNYWRNNGGLQIDPRATPTRRNNNPPTAFLPKNSWERGIATDDRGMPYLREDLTPMGVHEFAGRRHEFDKAKGRVTTSLTNPTTKEQ